MQTYIITTNKTPTAEELDVLRSFGINVDRGGRQYQGQLSKEDVDKLKKHKFVRNVEPVRFTC